MGHHLPPLAPPFWVSLIALGSMAFAVMFVAMWFISRRFADSPWAGRLAPVAYAGFCASFGLVLFSSGDTFLTFYLPAIFRSPWAAAAAGVLGVLLFVVRRKMLGLYAAVEIVGAVVTLMVVGFTSSGSTTQRAVALLGAAYFLVRGLDNADKGKLANSIRNALGSREGWILVATAALVITVVLLRDVLPSRYDAIEPPFLAGHDGSRLPVSPAKCGDLFIVCDEAAWREHERLSRAAPEERANAEAEAEARANAAIQQGIIYVPRRHH